VFAVIPGSHSVIHISAQDGHAELIHPFCHTRMILSLTGGEIFWSIGWMDFGTILKPADDVHALWSSIKPKNIGIPHLSDSICIGIEEYAKKLKIGKNFSIRQLKELLVDKKLHSAAADIVSDESTRERILQCTPQIPLSVNILNWLADEVIEKNLSQWGMESVLLKIGNFLRSKLNPQLDDSEENTEVVEEIVQDDLLVANHPGSYRPPITIGLWMISGRKCIHQMRLVKSAFPEEVEKLHEIINWFHQFNCTDQSLTHSSFMGNQDIFTDTGKWRIPDDTETQDTLFKYMAWIYKKGYDTFISEIQTPLFPLIEDIDCESTIPMNNTNLIDEIFLDPKFTFLTERAKALKIIYPHIETFTCHIYSSSGYNKSKGRWKSSFHLVWPDLVVDGSLAPIIRQTAVEYFQYKSISCKFFKRMQYRLINHYDANIWENIFDQTTSNSLNGLRMPFSNKTSWIKKSNIIGGQVKQPRVENRHCYPRGTVCIVMTTEKDNIDSSACAMDRLLEVEKILSSSSSILQDDQNEILQDRTQYKQIDKNTINRKNAFFSAMRSVGGDWVNSPSLNVTAKWIDIVDEPKKLDEESIALWIKRGSCRIGGMHHSKLTKFNDKFVQVFQDADLEFFRGHTIESLRQTDVWNKMTPAAQAGLKTRFRKFLQRQHVRPASVLIDSFCQEDPHAYLKDDLISDVSDDLADQGDDADVPPMEIDGFDYCDTAHENIRSLRDGSITDFEELMRQELGSAFRGGFWVYTNLSVSWIFELTRRTNGICGWGACVDVFASNAGSDSRESEGSVKVSFYYNSGKVIVSGDGHSNKFKAILKIVNKITQADDGLYKRVMLPNITDFSFPLMDENELALTRDEYEKRW